MKKNMHNLDNLSGLAWALLGSAGGIAKVFSQLLTMQTLPKKATIFWLFAANMFVSGFAGFLGAVLATNFTTDDNIHVAVAGIAGYMGVAALDFFTLWLKNRIGAKQNG